VGDPGGQSADGLHLGGLNKLQLGFLECGVRLLQIGQRTLQLFANRC